MKNIEKFNSTMKNLFDMIGDDASLGRFQKRDLAETSLFENVGTIREELYELPAVCIQRFSGESWFVFNGEVHYGKENHKLFKKEEITYLYFPYTRGAKILAEEVAQIQRRWIRENVKK